MARKKNNKGTVVKPKGNQGPKSAYDKSFCKKVRALADLGIPKYQVAHHLNISYAQLYRFEKYHKEFALALEESGFKRSNHAPSTYCEEYCGLIVELARREGLMLYQIAERLETYPDVLRKWGLKHLDFDLSLKRAKEASEVWWIEKIKDNIILDKDEKFNAAPFIFLMKNKFGWTDKREVDNHNRNETKFVIDIQNASIESLKKLKEMTPEQRKKTMKVVNG